MNGKGLFLSLSTTVLLVGNSSSSLPNYNFNDTKTVYMKSDSSSIDNLSDSSSSINTYKSNYKYSDIDIVEAGKELFGEMVYLSDEGQQEYNKILDDVFEDTEIKLFDFI